MKRVGFDVTIHLNCVDFMIPGDIPETGWFDYAYTHGWKEAIIEAIKSDDWFEMMPWPKGEEH